MVKSYHSRPERRTTPGEQGPAAIPLNRGLRVGSNGGSPAPAITPTCWNASNGKRARCLDLPSSTSEVPRAFRTPGNAPSDLKGPGVNQSARGLSPSGPFSPDAASTFRIRPAYADSVRCRTAPRRRLVRAFPPRRFLHPDIRPPDPDRSPSPPLESRAGCAR